MKVQILWRSMITVILTLLIFGVYSPVFKTLLANALSNLFFNEVNWTHISEVYTFFRNVPYNFYTFTLEVWNSINKYSIIFYDNAPFYLKDACVLILDYQATLNTLFYFFIIVALFVIYGGLIYFFFIRYLAYGKLNQSSTLSININFNLMYLNYLNILISIIPIIFIFSFIKITNLLILAYFNIFWASIIYLISNYKFCHTLYFKIYLPYMEAIINYNVDKINLSSMATSAVKAVVIYSRCFVPSWHPNPLQVMLCLTAKEFTVNMGKLLSLDQVGFYNAIKSTVLNDNAFINVKKTFNPIYFINPVVEVLLELSFLPIYNSVVNSNTLNIAKLNRNMVDLNIQSAFSLNTYVPTSSRVNRLFIPSISHRFYSTKASDVAKVSPKNKPKFNKFNKPQYDVDKFIPKAPAPKSSSNSSKTFKKIIPTSKTSNSISIPNNMEIEVNHMDPFNEAEKEPFKFITPGIKRKVREIKKTAFKLRRTTNLSKADAELDQFIPTPPSIKRINKSPTSPSSTANSTNSPSSSLNNNLEGDTDVLPTLSAKPKSKFILKYDDGTEKVLTKKLAKELQEHMLRYTGGFTSYGILQRCGDVNELANDDALFKSQIQLFFDKLDPKLVYTMIPNLRYLNGKGEVVGKAICESVKVHKNTNLDILVSKFKDLIHVNLVKYELKTTSVDFLLMGREWLPLSNFELAREELVEMLDSELANYLSTPKDKVQFDSIKDRLSKLKNYTYRRNYMSYYGSDIYNTKGQFMGYRLNDEGHWATLQFVYNESLGCITTLVSVRDLSCLEITPLTPALITWTDIPTSEGWKRVKDTVTYYYDHNNKIYNVELTYANDPYPIAKKSKFHDLAIGSIDLETYCEDIKLQEMGHGKQVAYAGGWAVARKTKLYYLNKGETSYDLLHRMLYEILKNPKYDGYTFYAHNFGRFDGVFILETLAKSNDLTVTAKFKSNTLLSLYVNYKFTRKNEETGENEKVTHSIRILDSQQVLQSSLRSILKSYNCKVQKGIFPYSFANTKRLNYVGPLPKKSYFSGITDADYAELLKTTPKYNLKEECLRYLTSDVEGLLEAITKMSTAIYNNYSLNLTKFITLPSLTAAIFTSNFLLDEHKPKFLQVKGELENMIRSAYFGGIVEVYINKVDTTAYYLDINSQYPNAMLKPMPVGNGTISLERNLDKVFGFVYGTIYAPTEEILKVPIVQHKHNTAFSNECPRGSFKRLICSEEMKYAVTQGYSIDIEFSILFEKGENIFKKFVETLYDIKKNTTDPVVRTLVKLLLNAFYGKLGMNEITSSMEIVNADKAEDIKANYNYNIYKKLSPDTFLVRYGSKVSSKVLKSLKDAEEVREAELNSQATTTTELLKGEGLISAKGIPSCVHMAAFITGYARNQINSLKNIPGNLAIMSDTDSIILPKPLSPEYIGGELGQFKLEHTISEGYFIRKKMYAIKDEKGKWHFKSSGTDSDQWTVDMYESLLQGNTVETSRVDWDVSWENTTVTLKPKTIKTSGVKGHIKTLFNTKDTNIKALTIYKSKAV